MVTLVTVKAAVPVLVRVTTDGGLDVPTVWSANVTLVGENRMLAAIPVPVRGTVCGLPLALSVTVSVPGSTPTADGVNVTPMLHAAPAFMPLPQLLVVVE